MRSTHEFFGFNSYLNFWTGVVEDIMDPLTAGRVRVRIHGIHDENRTNLPTNELPWSDILMPVTSATLSGVGHSPTGLKNGSWVAGVFLDGENCQRPLILGSLPGIHKTSSIAPGGGTGAYQQGGGNSGQGGQSGGGLPGGGGVGGGGVGGGGVPQTFPNGGFPGTSRPIQINDFTSLPASGRTRTGNIEGIAIHYTQDESRAIGMSGYGDWSAKSGTGANYYILRDGSINMLRGDNIQMGHIGIGRNERLDLQNSNTLGIEVQTFQGELPNQAQIDATKALVAAKAAEYNIPLNNVVSHGEITNSSHRMDMEGTLISEQIRSEGFSGYSSVTTQVVGPFDVGFGNSFDSFGQVGPNGTFYSGLDGTIIQAGGSNLFTQPSTPYGMPTGFEYVASENVGYNDPFNYYPTWPSQDMSTDPWARGWPANPDFDTNSVTTTDILREYQKEYGIEMAGGGTWEEPASPNVGQYPKNTVFRTEGGHVMEFDSTPNAERWHEYHPSGSYQEIDSRGNMVTKAHGDRRQIDEGNYFSATTGDYSITTQTGSLKMLAGADGFHETDGNMNMTVNLDMRSDVRGSMTLNGSKAMRFSAKHMTIEATDGPINMKSGDEINAEAGTGMSMQSGTDFTIAAKLGLYAIATGDVNVQGDKVNLQSGADLSLYSGADIKLEAANIHSKSDKHKFSGVIHSPNPPKTPDPIGAGDSADGANKAQDAMQKRAQFNQTTDRDKGSAGQDVAGNAMTDLNQEVKEQSKPVDRSEVPTKERPSSSDLKVIQVQTIDIPTGFQGGDFNNSAPLNSLGSEGVAP